MPSVLYTEYWERGLAWDTWWLGLLNVIERVLRAHKLALGGGGGLGEGWPGNVCLYNFRHLPQISWCLLLFVELV